MEHLNILSSLYLKPIDTHEVINELNSKKSTGPDRISTKYLEMSAQVIAPTLTNLFNNCITSGTFPSGASCSNI